MNKIENTIEKEQNYSDYIFRINRVIDYIEENLDKRMSLSELASVAFFSKYHFHRIFYSFTRETLFQFIRRLRLEKAAGLLLNNRSKTITNIAYECGFENPSAFSKSFKNYFNMSPSKYQKKIKIQKSNTGISYSNSGQLQSNPGKVLSYCSRYIEDINHLKIWRSSMRNHEPKIEVKEFPETTVAYVRYVGSYKGDADLFEGLYHKLYKWAGPRNLIHYPMDTIIIYHDDPEITEEDKLRTSLCIPVPEDTQTIGEIGKMTIPSGRYAFIEFELTPLEFQEAWDWVYGVWLPGSGFEPDDRPCFELYHHEDEKEPQGKIKVDICIPVRPM